MKSTISIGYEKSGAVRKRKAMLLFGFAWKYLRLSCDLKPRPVGRMVTMGHSSIDVTVDIYGHGVTDRGQEFAAKTDAFLFWCAGGGR
jgi:hypothetical protein